MRLSELLGLQWQCVDFSKGTILIDKQLSWLRKDDKARLLMKTKYGKERKISPLAEVETFAACQAAASRMAAQSR